MKRIAMSAIILAFAAAADAQQAGRIDRAMPAGAQAGASTSAQAGAGGTSASLSADTTIDAELTKSIDARKAKAGDEVVARVRNDVRQEGKVVLKHGAKLIGHVTQAQAKANGQENSQLGILFDRAEIKGGQSMDLHAAIQSLAPPPRSEEPAMGDIGTPPGGGGRGGMGSGEAGGGVPGAGAGGGGGGALGGVGNTVGGVGNSVGGAARGAGTAAGNAVGGAARGTGRAGGALGSSARGVAGMPGLQISGELSNSTNGTVLVSNDKDIKLDSGTQMVLRVEKQ